MTKLTPILQRLRRYLATTYGIFAVIALVFGTFFTFAVPLGYTEDEPVHIFRAYHVRQGHPLVQKLHTEKYEGQEVTMYGGKTPLNLIHMEQQLGSSNRRAALCSHTTCNQPTPEMRKEGERLSNLPLNAFEKYNIHFWGAGSYFFLPYVPTAFGMLSAELAGLSTGNIVLAGRLVALVTYVAIVCLALYLVRRSRARWILFSVALLPGSLVLAMSPGVDMLLNASAFLLFALVVRAFIDKSAFSLTLRILLFALAVVLPLYKPPYIILSLAALLPPIFPKYRKGWIWRASLFVAILMPALIFSALTVDIARTQSILTNEGGLPSYSEQIIHILKHPLAYIDTLARSFFNQDWLTNIGMLTHQRVPLPASVTAASLGLALAAGLAASKDFLGTLRKRLPFIVSFLGIGVIAFLGIVTSTYISYTPVAAPEIIGAQGRYFIPLLPFLALGIGTLLPVRIESGHAAKITFITAHLILLSIAAWWYYCKVYIWI